MFLKALSLCKVQSHCLVMTSLYPTLNADGTQCQSTSTARVFLDVHVHVQFAVLALLGLLCWICKKADDVYQSFEPLYADVAVTESAVPTLQQQMQQIQEDGRHLRASYAELCGEIEMVSDCTENVQWGLINMGAAQTSTRWHQVKGKMYSLARSKPKLIASRAVGQKPDKPNKAKQTTKANKLKTTHNRASPSARWNERAIRWTPD